MPAQPITGGGEVLTSRFGARRRREITHDEDPDHGPMRARYIPAALLLLGLMIAVGEIDWTRPEMGAGRRVLISPVEMFLMLIIASGVALGGLIAGAKVMDYETGTFHWAVLKIVSVAIFATALAIIPIKMDTDRAGFHMTGVSTGWGLMLVSYWIFVPLLFKIEARESMMTVAIIAITKGLMMVVIMSGMGEAKKAQRPVMLADECRSETGLALGRSTYPEWVSQVSPPPRRDHHLERTGQVSGSSAL